jgi:hypothetical protein
LSWRRQTDRPAGVIAYEASNAEALADRLLDALERRAEIAAAILAPVIVDTLEDEVQLPLA